MSRRLCDSPGLGDSVAGPRAVPLCQLVPASRPAGRKRRMGCAAGRPAGRLPKLGLVVVVAFVVVRARRCGSRARATKFSGPESALFIFLVRSPVIFCFF